MGLYSMMSVFLLSLNFNIWQFATKHICYSNIYTTYIAIYVTSQQRMVSKIKKNKNKQQQNEQKKKRKEKREIPTAWLEGQRKLSQNLARKICTRIYSPEMWLCNKKEGLQTLSNYWTHGTHCLLFQVFFSSVFVKWLIDTFLEMKLCILLFMRSTQYTEWTPGFQRGKNSITKDFAFLKPPCKNGSFI